MSFASAVRQPFMPPSEPSKVIETAGRFGSTPALEKPGAYGADQLIARSSSR